MEIEKLQASVIDSKWKNKYGLFAKHDVKMAGSNFVCYWLRLKQGETCKKINEANF